MELGTEKRYEVWSIQKPDYPAAMLQDFTKIDDAYAYIDRIGFDVELVVETKIRERFFI